MPRVGGIAGTVVRTRWKELGDAEVALRGWSQEVVLGVLSGLLNWGTGSNELRTYEVGMQI